MNKETLKELGIDKEDIINRLVDKLCEQYSEDEEGYRSDFEKRIEASVKQRVDETLAAAMDKHILPRVSKMVEGICLEETNKWGEKKGTKVTFVEYLVQRVDGYIREEVSYNGKTKGEDSYSWTASSTRIAHMIHKHLEHNISQAMQKALGDVNSSVRNGLAEAVKIALANIKVSVNTEVRTR